MKRNNLLFLILIPIFMLPGCSKEEASMVVEMAPEKVVRVESIKLEPRDIVEEFSLPGSLEAWKDLRLASEISGPVESVGAEEGERVQVGQELVKIDTLTLQTNYASARAEFAMRQKTERRMKELVEDQLVSAQEYDNAVGALDIATAALHSAEVFLAKGSLESPLNGLLEERYVEPGEYIGAGDPLVRVLQIDQLKVNVDVPEKDIAFLRKGADVTLEGSDISGWGYGTLHGKVHHMSYVADPSTRTYRVQIKIENPDAALRPGMIVRAHFIRRHLDQVLIVPLYAVVDRDEQKFVFIRNGETARKQQVLLGATLNGEVVVREGLGAGDEVIIKGQHLLSDGASIRTAEMP